MSLTIQQVVARSKRGVVEPRPAPEFHKGWGERVNEREFVKGLSTLSVRFSGRRDYVGLHVISACPYDKKVTYTFSVVEREGVRSLLFIRSRRGYGYVIRRLTLSDRDKISSLSSIIHNFLLGEPLCPVLKKLLPHFVQAY